MSMLWLLHHEFHRAVSAPETQQKAQPKREASRPAFTEHHATHAPFPTPIDLRELRDRRGR